MRRPPLRILAGIAAAPLLLAFLPGVASAADPSSLSGPGLTGVVPTVQEIKLTDGQPFKLTPATRILISDADADQLEDGASLFAGELVALDQLHGLGMNHAPAIVVGSEPTETSDIVLRLGNVEDLTSTEGYKLQVDGSVTITGSSDTGVFYGTRTILQSLASSGGAQASTVVDEPAKPERSLHVDAARKYYSPEWFEQVIRDMASIKLNQLQYHFSENEGFRLESKTHPEILSDEYLTQDEFAKLLTLAEQYHIEVVPALDLPGHLNQVLNEYPQFRASDTDEGRKVLDYSNPEARALIFEIVDEFAEFFPGNRWHMGGDEIFNVEDPSSAATRFPQLQDYAEAEVGPGASIHDGYIHFLNEMNSHLHSQGKDQVRVWNDALYGADTSVALDPSVDVTYWTKWHPSMPTVETIREHGHNVVNFNDGFFYYVLANPGASYSTPRPASDIYNDWRPGVFPNKDWTVPAAQRGQVYPEPSPDWLTGSSYAIWSDSPSRQTEEQVTAGIRLPLRAMAERVWNPSGSTATYDQWLARVEAIGTQPAAADLTKAPELNLTKTGVATRNGSPVQGDLQEGDQITWEVRATNDGDARLNVTVSDDLGDALDEVTLGAALFAEVTEADGTVVRAPGTNAALGQPASASGQEVANQWGPALAFDGVTGGQPGAQGSRWSSNGADNAWIGVELAEPTSVDHVTIHWEEACAAKYRIDVSTDGTVWVPATEEITPVCGSVDRQPLTTEGPVSFVRMQGLDRTPIEGKKYGMSLWEMQVWTGSEAGSITNPAVLDGTMLSWNGALEPGQSATVSYTGTVTASGNGRIVNTASLTSAYHPDFAATQSTTQLLAVPESTGKPTENPTDSNTPAGTPTGAPTSGTPTGGGPASTTAGVTPGGQGSTHPGDGSASGQDGTLASTGATATGTLAAAAALLLILGIVLRRRRAAHA